MHQAAKAEYPQIQVNRLTTTDNHQFEVFWQSAALARSTRKDAARPVILILSAMGVPARSYRELISQLAEAGLHAAAMEWRGIGSSNLRASHQCDFGFDALINRDIRTTLNWLKQQFAGAPTYLFGHSLGGQIGFLTLAKFEQEIEGIITVASGSPWYKNWQGWHRYGLFASSLLMKWSAKLLGYFPGKLVGFAGNESKGVMADWRYAVRHGRYRPKGDDFDYEGRLTQLTKKALMITIDKDWLAPEASSRQLGAKLASGSVIHQHLPVDVFDSEMMNHFLWMKEPGPIVKRIVQWMAV